MKEELTDLVFKKINREFEYTLKSKFDPSTFACPELVEGLKVTAWKLKKK